MRVRIEHRLGDNYDDLTVPKPTSDYPCNQHGVRIKTYRIAAKSLDTFLSRLYTHTLRECVRQTHLHAPILYWYADIHFALAERDYNLTLAICAPYGYITRRLHYLYNDSAIERSESSGLWIAYTRSLDVLTSESIVSLVQSLT